MIAPRLARACSAVIAVAGVLATAGCGGPDDGPLMLAAYGNVLEPQARGAWFNVDGCARSKSDPAVDIMVTSISPSEVSGDGSHRIRTLVAWAAGTGAGNVISAPGTPPDSYRPVAPGAHLGGTLEGCSVRFAIVVPPAVDVPVQVHGLDVTYEADGDTYTAHADVDLALCPPGTSAGTVLCDG